MTIFLAPSDSPAGSRPEGGTRTRFAPHLLTELRIWGPQALVVVGTEGPLSVMLLEAGGTVIKQRFGHNRGVWPLRLARSAAWKDTVTHTYDRSPFVPTGTLFRVWCESDAHEARLAVAVGELLGRMSEEARGAELINGFTDVGPDLDPAMLEMEVHALATRMGFRTWDDGALRAELERLARARDGVSRR